MQRMDGGRYEGLRVPQPYALRYFNLSICSIALNLLLEMDILSDIEVTHQSHHPTEFGPCQVFHAAALMCTNHVGQICEDGVFFVFGEASRVL